MQASLECFLYQLYNIDWIEIYVQTAFEMGNLSYSKLVP